MRRYDPNLTLRQARSIYFRDNNLGEGGYTDKWVKIMAGPFPIIFPNGPERVRSLRFHDLHHVLTEYQTTWTGESEIGAWEIATGCADHIVAWYLNLQAMVIGLFIAPRAIYRAYVRGLHSRNLYATKYSDAVLKMKVGDMRKKLRLSRKTVLGNAGIGFYGWSMVGMVLLLGVITLAIGVLAALGLGIWTIFS